MSKGWSESLTEKVESFLKGYIRDVFSDSKKVEQSLRNLIDEALDEGFENARETVADWFEPEPLINEGYA